MKTITINITHDEVFEEFIKSLKDDNIKNIKFIQNNESHITINISGTLDETYCE